MVLQVYDARGSLPSSSSFLCVSFLFFFFVSLHGVWWAWDGSLLFFSLSLLSLLHTPYYFWGSYYLLPTTSPIYLDIPLFLRMEHSAEAAQCRGCTRVSYTIYLALSVAWHHVGIIGGFGVWAERFASTDSQSYIYLIGRSWSFFSFSFS
jgi:hypothetical protein